MATAPQLNRMERRQARALRTPEEKLHGFYVHLIVYLCVNAGLAILNFRRNPEHLWFYWVAMGWGIGIAFHAFQVFRLTRQDAHESEMHDGSTRSDDTPTMTSP